jgi:DNA modification methylase
MDVDPRNRLNGLSNSEWLRLTSSVWWNVNQRSAASKVPLLALETIGEFPTVMNSSPPPLDDLKRQHPATFAECDIRKLISFFSKREDVVLDPFLGAGSTMLTCLETERNCIGVELFGKWVSLSRKRLENAYPNFMPIYKVTADRDILLMTGNGLRYRILCGDSRERLKELRSHSVDLILTSPPYWNILDKTGDYKALRMRRNFNLPTNYGSSKKNLGNIGDYSEFLRQLKIVFRQCARVLRSRKYLCVIVSDFRHRNRFYPFHAHLTNAIERCGLALEGITVIVNNRKHLYPYGLPYSYVSNIHHSYVLIFRKMK